MSPPTMTQGKAELVGLTGVRGFAALWIVFYHIRPFLKKNFGDQTWALDLVYAGYLAVDLFAFLSGFVIALSYSELLQTPNFANTKKYLWYRLARIYPLIVFVLLLFSVWYLISGVAESISDLPHQGGLLRQLLMINSLGIETGYFWNVPSWSVSIEWFCYLLFPLAAPLLCRFEKPFVAIVVMILIIAATIFFMHRIGRINFLTGPVDLGGVKIIGEFYAGAVLFHIYRLVKVEFLPWQWIGLIALAYAVYISSESPVTAVILFPIVVFALTQIRGPGILSWIFCNRVSVYLGEISYSIYLIHWLLFQIWGKTPLWFNQAPIIQLVIALVLLMLASVFCYHAIEAPSRRWLRRVVN